MNVEKIKKYWPLALFLLAGSVVGTATGLVRAVSDMVGAVSRNELQAETCNLTPSCARENLRFVEFLQENSRTGQRFDLILHYQDVVTGVGPADECRTTTDDGATSTPSERSFADHSLTEMWLPIDENSCDSRLVRFVGFDVPPRSTAMGTLFYRVAGSFVAGGGSGGLLFLTRSEN